MSSITDFIGSAGGQTIDQLLAKLPAIDAGTAATTSTSDLDQLNILFGSATGMAMVAASTTAMNAVAASTAAMNAVIASTTAMNAVVASTTAMNAVVASTTAMNALYAGSTKFNWIGTGNWYQGISTAPGATIFNGAAWFVRATFSGPWPSVGDIYIDGVTVGHTPTPPIKANSAVGFTTYTTIEIAYIPL